MRLFLIRSLAGLTTGDLLRAGWEREEIELRHKLLTIRNWVIHLEGYQIGKGEALEYVQLALKLGAKLRKKYDFETDEG